MNNLELLLLRLLLYNNNYIKYKHLIDYSYIKEYSIELYYIYKALGDLYEVTNAATLQDLEAYFFSKYQNNADRYKVLFDSLKEIELSDEVVESVLTDLNKKKNALLLSEKAFAFTQGRASIEDITSAYDSIYTPVIQEDDPDEFVSTDIEDLINGTVVRPGLRWRLSCLNKSLGSLRQGDFGAVFARPETGKTTFLSSETSFMLDQLSAERPLLWCNNEEQGGKVMLRIAQAYFGLRLDQLRANMREVKLQFQERVGDKIKFVDSAAIDKAYVEDLMAKHNPGLLVFDQMDKVKGFKAERDDLLYGTIYQWGRELAKQYCPVISVCQADGTAEGSKWLFMNHMALAKTSKQAECDWILGIGKTHMDGAENMRYLNLSKNKLAGDADSNPDLRHGRFDVLIRPEIARYEDIVIYD